MLLIRLAKRVTELLIDEIKVLTEADSLPGQMPTEQELMRIFSQPHFSSRGPVGAPAGGVG